MNLNERGTPKWTRLELQPSELAKASNGVVRLSERLIVKTLMNSQSDFKNIRCDAYNDDPTRVARVAARMPDPKRLEKESAILKAVSDPTRLRILFALTCEPLCVCELSTLLSMSMPAVSHHLRLLVDANLLTVKKSGKFACYYLSDVAKSDPVRAVIDNLNCTLAGAVA